VSNGNYLPFQETISELVIKIEEYVPTIMPTIKANEKYLILSPPKKNIADKTIRVVREVFKHRVKLWLTLWSIVSPKLFQSVFKRFSLARSKITILLLTE